MYCKTAKINMILSRQGWVVTFQSVKQIDSMNECILPLFCLKIAFNLNPFMLQYFSEPKSQPDIKYSPEDFLFRWKKLQRVMQKDNQDGLLLVTGLDGAQCTHTNYLFNWLFLGLSGPAIFNNKYLDPIYSQIIVIVSPKQSFLFLTPQAKQEFEPLVYALQNCHVYCPTDKQYAAKDTLDILKISFFYQAVSKLNKIGLFLAPEDNAKIIEKWPIIQSYALEPVGKTFFTLKFQCANLNLKVVPLFRNLDKHSLQNLVATTANSLEGQVRGSTQLIEYTPQQERYKITQVKLQQPLFEAADIAKFQTTSQAIPPIRVLFGSRTAGKHESSTQTVAQAKAHHFIIEHADPVTKLQIWRTYFLNLCTETIPSIQILQEQQKQSFLINRSYHLARRPTPAFEERKWLIASYLGIVQGVVDGISTISKDYRNLNTQFLNTHILSKLNQSTSPNGGDTYSKKDLEVYLESYDAQGEPKPIDFKDSITFKLSTSFYVIKARLNNVKCPKTGKLLGSLCFSQSFLLQQGCYLLLTKQTPYFDFWKTDQEQLSALANLNPNIPFPQLGPCLSPEFRYRMFIPLAKLSSIHFNIPVMQVKYHFHENGLRIYSQKTGWHILLYQNIVESTMVNKIPGQWVLFKTKSAFLFEGIQSNILAMEFRGKAFDSLLKKVNDKNSPLPLDFLDVIPPMLSDDNWYFTQEVLKRDVREGALLYQHQILQNQFLWSFIEAKQLMVLNQMKDIKLNTFRNLYLQRVEKKFQAPQPSQKPHLAVITGTYTTGKYRIAQTLARFGKKQTSYHVFHISYQNLFSRMQTATFVEMLAQFIEDAPQGPKKLFLVVIPSWLNAAEAIPALNQKYEVTTVISVASVGGFYSTKNGSVTDNALTFAVPGFTQSIVLDSRGESEAQISAIHRILWAFNREAKITRSSNSTLSTGQVVDLLGDKLYNSEYHRFLRNKYGSLYRFDSLSKLQVGFIEFKYPICDLPALKTLSRQEGWLLDWNIIREELKEKREEAQNSKDQLMETLYRLEEATTLLRKRQKLPRIHCIKGVIRNQEGQKIQILWSGQQLRERLLSDNTRSLGIFIMASNYDEYQIKQFLLSLTYRKLMLEGLKVHRTPSSLSEQEMREVSKEGMNKYLQDGEYFDGYFYRDIQGHILPQHPKLALLQQQWLSERNRQIDAHNQKLKQEWETYKQQYE